VAAYSVADGTPAWTFPPDHGDTAASVVGTTDELLVGLATEARGSSAGRAETRLVTLDAEGEEAWSVELGRGYWTGTLWDSAVVVQGVDPQGGPQLRAFSPESGEELWQVRSKDAPPVGDQPRTTFGAGVPLGDDVAVPSPNGVLLVDPDSGEVERRDSEVAVEELFPSGDHLVVRTDDALLVVRGSV
jgi:outer membrane protein assembly factor BamB